MNALSFDHVSFRYEPESPQVINDVTFTVEKGSFTLVVGPSGEGKSTILRLAAGLVHAQAGTIINTMRTRMIFQNGALLPWRTVSENIALGFNGLQITHEERAKRTGAVLEELGIGEFADSYPRDLSGGQRQRAGIARALVSEPELLLLDEPFSALDVETTRRLAEELLDIRAKRGITMLMVSHSIEDAVVLGDRVLVCSAGKIAHDVKVPLPRPRDREDAQVIALANQVRGFLPHHS